jgi:CheY-like chemotaxis protein
MLTVSDTGCGIPSAQRDRLFLPFSTSKEHGWGAGLGLPTVHGIVRGAGGWIEFDSEQGAGTSFRIWLPRTEAALQDEHSSPRASLQAALDAGPPARILIVDDADETREILTRVLLEAGFEVETAQTAEAALALLNGPGPRVDLLLADVVLPDLSGIELAKQVPAGTRVLLMTGYSQEAIAQYGPTRHGLVLKPIRAQSLIQRLRYELRAVPR